MKSSTSEDILLCIVATYPGPCGWNEYLARPYSGSFGSSISIGEGGDFWMGDFCSFGGVFICGDVSTASVLAAACLSISFCFFKRSSSASRSRSRAWRICSRSFSISWFFNSCLRNSRKSTVACGCLLTGGSLTMYVSVLSFSVLNLAP